MAYSSGVYHMRAAAVFSQTEAAEGYARERSLQRRLAERRAAEVHLPPSCRLRSLVALCGQILGTRGGE